eukprot:symbB.v1.2.024145.t1/scaffold2265.1/size102435/5
MSDHSDTDYHDFTVIVETCFVVRNEAYEVVGVDEGRIALALLKGQKEMRLGMGRT